MAEFDLESSRACLLDLSQPLPKRTNAAFHLRTIGTQEAAAAIAEALCIREDGCLMRHELGYILGQMGHSEFCGVLSSVLSDEADDLMVRHEAAEALGAIGNPSSLPILESFCNHSAPEISETCQLAADLIRWRQTEETAPKSSYLSVDPAPALPSKKSIPELNAILNDPSVSLFHRYRAMFSLRDMNTDASALALVDGFNDSSALFRHEIAYVLGQMERPVTIPGLAVVLRNEQEHRMVRHEAAEALGAIGGEAVKAILCDYQEDKEQVVKDSCDVALNIIDYWSNFSASG
eukprot:gene5380-10755_t